jgi:hypothetical protein
MNEKDWLQVDREVYIPWILVDGPEDGNRTGVSRATVLSITAESVLVKLHHPKGDTDGEIPIANVFPDEHSAAKRILAIDLLRERRMLKKAIPDIDLVYPATLRAPAAVVMSSNPLRAGEPCVAYSAQSNVWGTNSNPQKLLQIAGSVWEDIKVLFGTLYLLGFAGDYAKKLLGKYIIVEMRSLFDVLSELRKVDKTYEALFIDLQRQLSVLDKEFGYATLRNKVGAHRDSDLDALMTVEFWRRITRYNLSRHLDVFQEHLRKLGSVYEDEVRLYFSGPIAIPGLSPSRSNDESEYETFDPFVYMGDDDTD